MNFENWISYRYLTSHKGGFLAFLHFISVSGVAVGVMALIVVTGVMTGFGNNLREKIIGTIPHVVVEKETGIVDYQGMQKDLSQLQGVVGVSPYIQGNIFLEDGSQAMGQVVRGIDPQTEGQVTKIDQYLTKGSLTDLTADKVIIGSELARYFGYDLGDKITIIAPGSGIAGRGWRYQLEVAGIFNTGMADYDMNLLVVDLKKAQRIFDLPDNVASGIGIKISDPYQAKEMKEKIYRLVGFSFLVKTWIDVNRNLFEALAGEVGIVSDLNINDPGGGV